MVTRNELKGKSISYLQRLLRNLIEEHLTLINEGDNEYAIKACSNYIRDIRNYLNE